MMTKVGILGCGNICDIYIQNIMQKFDNLQLVALANRTRAKAEDKAKEYGIDRVETIPELLDDQDIDVIVILTSPLSHADLVKQCLLHHKHVYVEKPLALCVAETQELLELAKTQHLLLGVAPDTLLGGGMQECKKIIDSGEIGDIVAVDAFMTCRGHERWHPNPDFFYQKGAGPLFDVGPYYLSALVNLVGPVTDVAAMATKTFATRTVETGEKKGEIIQVNVPTHYSGSMKFKNGAIGTLIMSFDIWKSSLPRIEIHGTKGSLVVPDPNTFGGPLLISREGKEWEEVPLSDKRFIENSRGLGVSDLMHSLSTKRPPIANAEIAQHVVEIITAFDASSNEQKTIHLATTCPHLPPLDISSTR